MIISDAIKFLEHLEDKPDIIFADPPYDYENYQKLTELALKKLNNGGFLSLNIEKVKTLVRKR